LPTETFDTITEDEAMDILMTDVEIARMQLAKAFPWVLGLDDARLHVLYELCFWIGIGGVGKFKKMLACIRVQDWEGASKNLLDSLLYKQVPRRTKELAKILLEGQ
jgi:lysozyme